LYVEDDYLWIATHSQGIALLDLKTKEFLSYKNQKNIPYNLQSPTWANSIYKDSKNTYWFAACNSLYKKEGDSLVAFANNPSDKNSIVSSHVDVVFEDSKGRLWVLTNEGVELFNTKTETFEHYTQLYNLPNNAKAILEDNNNNLWISSNKGLYCFNPETKTSKIYSIEHGLPSNDFLYKSAYKLKNGDLLFGGTSGFVMFNPNELYTSQNKPIVVLSNLLIDHKKQVYGDSASVLNKAVQFTDTLVLDYNNSIITIEFAGIDFSNSNLITYSYQLEGLKDDWISLGKDRSISVSKLSPGTYTLRIKAHKEGGVYSENGKGLTIIILPPWWQTWLFYIVVFVLLILLFVAVFNLRVKRIKERNKQLEELVKNRTIDLHIANAGLQELNTTKDKLFSIIAHDLRNPISTLMGYAELLLEKFDSTKPEAKKDYISRIFSSSKLIYSQLEQLLNWATAQSKNIKKNPKDTELKVIVEECVGLVTEMAAKKEITIFREYNTTRMAFVDPRMISTVIRNIVSNAIKFTNNLGEISITTTEDKEWILLTILDNGVGMTEKQLEVLFSLKNENSSLGTNNEEGSGIGLLICKEFIEKNGGELLVSSKVGDGSCFTCKLPAGSTFYKEMESHVKAKQEEKIQVELPEVEIEVSEKPILLVVEDMSDIAKYLFDSFSKEYAVTLAENGLVGLELCRKLLPDIVISDVSMPEMDGEELTIALKSDPLTNHIPIILLTARNLPEQELMGLKKGADDYITKPFDRKILQEKLKTLLKNRELFKDYIKRKILTEIEQGVPASQKDVFLEFAVKIIEENIAAPNLSVEFLASELAISRAQLFRKFKAITGQSPLDFIRDIKLRKAALLLKTGEWRVSDVAFELGFSDPNYFSKSFQKVYGVTPSKYKKMV